MTRNARGFAQAAVLGSVNSEPGEIMLSLNGPRGGSKVEALSPAEAFRLASQLIAAAAEIIPDAKFTVRRWKAETGSQYSVISGIFPQFENAERLAEHYRKEGWQAFTEIAP